MAIKFDFDRCGVTGVSIVKPFIIWHKLRHANAVYF